MRKINLVIKRFADVVLSLVGIIILFPILLVVATVIKVSNPGQFCLNKKDWEKMEKRSIFINLEQ